MKKLMMVLLCCFILTVFANAQEAVVEREQSDIEKFSSRTGTLIERTIINIGKARGFNIQVTNLTDLLENTKISGIRLETDTIRNANRPDIAYIDKDEIDTMIKSLGIIKNKITSTRPESYTEVTFTSRSGFSAGCYLAEAKWRIYMKFDPLRNDSFVYLQFDELDAIIALFDQAKQKLN